MVENQLFSGRSNSNMQQGFKLLFIFYLLTFIPTVTEKTWVHGRHFWSGPLLLSSSPWLLDKKGEQWESAALNLKEIAFLNNSVLSDLAPDGSGGLASAVLELDIPWLILTQSSILRCFSCFIRKHATIYILAANKLKMSHDNLYTN